MDVLARPVYAPLWTAARRRVEGNGLSLVGTAMVLRDLTAAQADAIVGLLGVPRPAPGAPLRVTLLGLDRALRTSSVERGLLEVLGQVGGPLVDRRAGREVSDMQRAQQWADLGAHAAVVGEARLASWLEQVRTTGLARRLARGDEAQALGTALDVVAIVAGGGGGHRLAVLAARVTGDAHGLDRGKPAGTLAVHALSHLSERPFPQDAADWRRVWSDAGVACDDLSCDVLVLNLPGWPAEPLRLTLRQASSWTAPRGTDGVIYVSENPAVVAAAADHLGDRAPAMVCLDGMPSTAALVVLDGVAALGCAVRYHGDFDWRGLAIAGVLARKLPGAQPWRYGGDDYRRALDLGLGTVALTGRVTPSPWDPALAPVMEAAGVAVYEEQVLDDLLDDLEFAGAR
jgi:uncharacterized protein (TIGR02679 family)